MTKTQYKYYLQSSKWDEVRIAILKRDDFKCKHCGESDKELHVHHGKYIDGRMP